MNDYIRTDDELAHQAAYEARESSRHYTTTRITYRIVQERADHFYGPAKMWFVVRQVGDTVERSGALARQVEAEEAVREHRERDFAAAKRLGVEIS